MDDLYLDTILDLYKNPRHKGWIESTPSKGSVFSYKAYNASCGDQMEVALEIKDGKVVQAKWRGQGCAISCASTDLVCEWIIGKVPTSISSLTEEELLSLIGLESITSAREKCLFLPLRLH